MKNELIHFISDVPSTNKLLSELARQAAADKGGLPPFYTIYTDFQSAGRGMGSNTWFSDRGKNILASFHFVTHLPAAQQFIFNQYFALATLEFVREFVPEALIKWPNDIYVHGKKLAGDLTEHTLSGNQLRYTIAGLGLNVNQDKFPDNIPNPTSIYLETGKDQDIKYCISKLWQTLYNQINKINNPEGLQNEYLQNLYLLNEVHHYIIRGEEMLATIRGTDKFGRLVIEDQAGQSHICGFKEVVFL